MKPLIALTVIAIAAPARADLINVVSTDRRVSASATIDPTTDSHEFTGPTTGNWIQTASANVNQSGGPPAFSSAFQNSTIGPSSISGTFSVGGSAPYPGMHMGAASSMSVQFQLFDPVSYSASADGGHSAPTNFSLTGPSGTVFSASPTFGNSYNGSGQLLPGTYTLVYGVSTTADVASADHAPMSFTLTAIPAPGVATTLALAAAALARRKRPLPRSGRRP
jgi:hypothetical protein